MMFPASFVAKKMGMVICSGNAPFYLYCMLGSSLSLLLLCLWTVVDGLGTALPCGDRRELGSRRVTRVIVIVVSWALIDRCQAIQGS